MDEIKAQKKALKKAYKQAKRKNVLAWKILTILCAVVMVISVPLSVLAVKFDNTMAARFGGSFWKLQNEDTNAQYYTSDFNSAEEMVDYGLALTQQVEAEGAALLMNNNNALPLAADAKVSTFSSSSVNLVYGGTGSGNIDASTADTLRTALEKVGVTVNPTLWDFYTVGAGKDYARSKSGTVATASEVTAEVPWDILFGNAASHQVLIALAAERLGKSICVGHHLFLGPVDDLAETVEVLEVGHVADGGQGLALVIVLDELELGLAGFRVFAHVLALLDDHDIQILVLAAAQR